MTALVRHFGDKDDAGADCGTCDWCAPAQALCAATRTRPLNEAERGIALWVLNALATAGAGGDGAPSTGKLARDWAGDRRLFERVITALSKARLLSFYDDSFEKDGSVIRFRRVYLSEDGRVLRNADQRLASLNDVRISEELAKSKASKSKRSGKGRSSAEGQPAVGSPAPETVTALKSWRLAIARSEKVPAFRILSDRVLMAIAAARPENQDALLAVHGMGPRLCEKFGRDILGVLRSG